MAIYNKVAKALVYDLINEANPTLSKPVTELNARLGVPAAIANAVFPAANTTIKLSPVPGTADYIGSQTVKYRRLDLSRMFRGINATVVKYAPKSVGAAAGTVMFTVYELLNDINKLYGLKLTEDDLTNANIVRGSTQEGGQYTTTITVSVKATSLGFVGSFALKWINTPQSIADMITNTDLDGRLFPGGNVFDGSHKPICDSVSFGVDCTADLLASLVNTAAFGRQGINWNTWGNIYPNVICPLLRRITGNQKWRFTSNGSYTTFDGELMGWTHALYQLPNAAFPEGNSRFYGWVMVLFAPDDCTWATGAFVLHFNKS
jgi:hypothetical protein